MVLYGSKAVKRSKRSCSRRPWINFSEHQSDFSRTVIGQANPAWNACTFKESQPEYSEREYNRSCKSDEGSWWGLKARNSCPSPRTLHSHCLYFHRDSCISCSIHCKFIQINFKSFFTNWLNYFFCVRPHPPKTSSRHSIICPKQASAYFTFFAQKWVNLYLPKSVASLYPPYIPANQGLFR